MDADQQALSGGTYDVILFKGDQHLNETYRSNQTAAMQKYTFQRFRKLEDYLNYSRSIVQFYIMVKMFIFNYGVNAFSDNTEVVIQTGCYQGRGQTNSIANSK
jgi:hypothetical protein